MPRRRQFLGHIGALAAMATVDIDEMKAQTKPDSKWDLSWIDALSSASYRVVFNAENIADGAAMDYAETFLDQFHDVLGTSDTAARPVIVFRRLGTPMALDDVLWDRYGVGADAKVVDRQTSAPATRNIYKKQIESLHQRGLISLVCNIALHNWSARAAQRTNRKSADVFADAREHLVAGAIVVPSGIFALIRAQNAGCAFMPGT